MANVFISYTRADQKQVAAIAEALTRKGYTVWWDTSLLAGARFRATIALQLAAAQCVVVVWSPISVNSDWVLDEAEYAKKQEKLIPIEITTCAIPLGFRQLQTESFVDWNGTKEASQFHRLCTALTAQIAISCARGVTGKIDEAVRSEARSIKLRSVWRSVAYRSLPIVAGATLLGLIATYIRTPYVIASIFQRTVATDVAALRDAVDYQTVFRTLEKEVMDNDRLGIVANLSHHRLAEIASLGHTGNSPTSVENVLAYFARMNFGDSTRVGAALDAISYLHRISPASSATYKLEQAITANLRKDRAIATICDKPCNEEWALVSTGTPRLSSSPINNFAAFCLRRTDITVAEYHIFDPDYPQSAAETDPIRNISWFDAAAYAAWKNARLPRFEELNVALKLSGITEDPMRILDYAWLLQNSADSVQSVASKKPDRLGLFDLVGNVYAWTSDWYVSDQQLQLGGQFTRSKLVFGASYQTSLKQEAMSFRNQEGPFAQRAYLGMRLARDPTRAGDCRFTDQTGNPQ